MIRTPTATGLQLARAEWLGKALAQRGWTYRREPKENHPGAVAAIIHSHLGIRVLVLTLGGVRGQMVEITAAGTSVRRGDGARRVRDTKPSWRLTSYDSPMTAIFAAALAAAGGSQTVEPLDDAGWTVRHAPARKVGAQTPRTVRATLFTRPDGAVTATFHVPTYNPPCEHCKHHGELGDAGGWLITGPGFTAEASAHTPAAVIGAFARALPGDGDCTDQPTAPREFRPVDPRPTKSIPAASTALGARLTVAVR